MSEDYKSEREWRIWERGGARREKQCRLGGGMLRMWNGSFGCGVVECGPQNGQAKQNYNAFFYTNDRSHTFYKRNEPPKKQNEIIAVR